MAQGDVRPMIAQGANKESEKKQSTAAFAGGCFWCMQSPFDDLPGVTATTVGYMGGRTKNPTYEEVSTGVTGHVESVQVVYDPTRVTYTDLLDAYWRSFDPTDEGGQFADRGSHYRPAIFYYNEEQKRSAETSKKVLAASGRFGDRSIQTAVLSAGPFYPAEIYHQCYYKKNPQHYNRYKVGSGRADFLKRIWGKPEGGK